MCPAPGIRGRGFSARHLSNTTLTAEPLGAHVIFEVVFKLSTFWTVNSFVSAGRKARSGSPRYAPNIVATSEYRRANDLNERIIITVVYRRFPSEENIWRIPPRVSSRIVHVFDRL
ncbi:hypothetical protein EVAR_16651_1 [Eumeta japonica]|uniref:Uncharacterized protein n=1 Tax=Eumeta variegata TaxID=151549 RepID=A0A4C1V0S9_EUMVA|nr:hypothetical protein EVAR_16651_1 [Eumeta japonica]